MEKNEGRLAHTYGRVDGLDKREPDGQGMKDLSEEVDQEHGQSRQIPGIQLHGIEVWLDAEEAEG
jgi:hypothetical protein